MKKEKARQKPQNAGKLMIGSSFLFRDGTILHALFVFQRLDFHWYSFRHVQLETWTICANVFGITLQGISLYQQ